MSDLAGAMGEGQIKTGSVCRSERFAEFKRLLEIEPGLSHAAVFDGPLKEI